MRSLTFGALVVAALAACTATPSAPVRAPTPVGPTVPSSPASLAKPSRTPPPPLTSIPPGVDTERARLAASLCAAAYDPERKAVGCRSHPPFDNDAQQPDGTLPPWKGEPQRLCEINDLIRGSFSAKGKDEALVVFAACQGNDDDTWDMGFPGSAVLVEQREGRWQPTGYVPDVNLNLCLKERRKDGRDVMLCRSNLMTGVMGSVFYVFVVDLAHDGARTVARMFSHDELCPSLVDTHALDRGYTHLELLAMSVTDGTLAVKVRRAHVAAAPDLFERAKKACAANAKLPAIVPAGRETTLELRDDGTRFVPTPATKALLDRWETESPDRFNGLIEVGPPNAPTSCAFPPVSPSEGTTAKQCCQPATGVELCLETVSQLGQHELRVYTERTLTLRSAGHPDRSFPLDRQRHVNMRSRDEVFARLSFDARETALELQVRQGCVGLCSGDACSPEQKRIATLCATAGTYPWDGTSP